jgi:hypothetical protein
VADQRRPPRSRRSRVEIEAHEEHVEHHPQLAEGAERREARSRKQRGRCRGRQEPEERRAEQDARQHLTAPPGADFRAQPPSRRRRVASEDRQDSGLSNRLERGRPARRRDAEPRGGPVRRRAAGSGMPRAASGCRTQMKRDEDGRRRKGTTSGR